MTYQEKFVCVVKHGSKIMRERDGCIMLPFGAEYTLLLKNLDSRRSLISVSIDGEDVLGGNSLVIGGNGSTELEGFLDGSIVRNKFRFIQKTQEIIKRRGDQIDDGLIRVEFRFEKMKPVVIEEKHHHYDYYHHHYDWTPYNPWPRWPRPRRCRRDDYPPHIPYYNNLVTSSSFCESGEGPVNLSNIGSVTSGDIQINHVSSDGIMPDLAPAIPNEDEGITVRGSSTFQQFHSAYVDELEENSHTIIIRLRGINSTGVLVKKSITTKTRLNCPTCGKKSRSDMKYCSKCGTAL